MCCRLPHPMCAESSARSLPWYSQNCTHPVTPTLFELGEQPHSPPFFQVIEPCWAAVRLAAQPVASKVHIGMF